MTYGSMNMVISHELYGLWFYGYGNMPCGLNGSMDMVTWHLILWFGLSFYGYGYVAYSSLGMVV